MACGVDPCPAGGVDPLAALRLAVRECEHGVLVRSGGCPLALLPRTSGTPACTTSQPGAGPFVLVQPCDAARRASGEVVVAGPLHESADVIDLCHWLTDGLLTGTPLPGHLRPAFVISTDRRS